MNRKITFSDVAARKSRVQNAPQNGGTRVQNGGAPHSDVHPGASRPLKEDLYKERPDPVYIPGQGLSVDARKRNQARTLRYGYERLGHMYSLRIPVKFEELQGRHPFGTIPLFKHIGHRSCRQYFVLYVHLLYYIARLRGGNSGALPTSP